MLLPHLIKTGSRDLLVSSEIVLVLSSHLLEQWLGTSRLYAIMPPPDLCKVARLRCFCYTKSGLNLAGKGRFGMADPEFKVNYETTNETPLLQETKGMSKATDRPKKS